MRVLEVGAVEGDNVRRAAVVHDLELAEDLSSYRGLGVDVHELSSPQSAELLSPGRSRAHLSSHDELGRDVDGFRYGPSIARSQIAQELQVLRMQVQLELQPDLERRQLLRQLVLVVAFRARGFRSCSGAVEGVGGRKGRGGVGG